MTAPPQEAVGIEQLNKNVSCQAMGLGQHDQALVALFYQVRDYLPHSRTVTTHHTPDEVSSLITSGAAQGLSTETRLPKLQSYGGEAGAVIHLLYYAVLTDF